MRLVMYLTILYYSEREHVKNDNGYTAGHTSYGKVLGNASVVGLIDKRFLQSIIHTIEDICNLVP